MNERIAEIVGYMDEGDVGYKPYTCLLDAFDAAERFKLFDHPKGHGHCCLLWRDDEESTWHVEQQDEEGTPHMVGSGQTPEVAICHAIIHLNAQQP